jgi:flagellar hook-associated protein 1 FlgK
VNRANELLKGIEDSTASIMKFGRTPALLDERDRMITELSGLVGVRTMEAENGALTLTTTGGATLFSGTAASRLEFDNRGILGSHNLYAPPPAASGVGTITAVSASGGRIDLLSAGAIRSGEIAAAVELRDGTLVEAQRQLDELAAGLALGHVGKPPWRGGPPRRRARTGSTST